MAVMKMKLLSIIGSIDQLDAVLDTCCSSENFHLDQAMSFFKDKSEFVSLNDEFRSMTKIPIRSISTN